jgi:hypothetical protein
MRCCLRSSSEPAIGPYLVFALCQSAACVNPIHVDEELWGCADRVSGVSLTGLAS